MSGNNPYVTGAGMGEQAHEGLALREKGEGLDFVSKWSADNKAKEVLIPLSQIEWDKKVAEGLAVFKLEDTPANRRLIAMSQYSLVK